MYNIVSVSNRGLCDDFFGQLKKISAAGIPIILREKDLSEAEYEQIARRIMEFCPDVILHTFLNTAERLGCKRIHLPMHIFRAADLSEFETVGASIHSVEEAVEAQKLGASYITAGHIFATNCKKGVEPRGLDFLKSVCGAVEIPVLAIGGIAPENARSVMDAGASGMCVMSGFMQCGDVKEYLDLFGGFR
ncbi:MAG: thiamine phosphate synthase [Oscillospiraceae bacterium]|nr:thiamine phosphate synthase [Oscillospiraceae bacterium]